jgi:hypothetical protein
MKPNTAGNAYVFSWATTLFVLETLSWYIRDSRSSVHHMLEQKDEEYKAYQQKVLEKSQKLQEDAARREDQGQETSHDWARNMFRRNTLSAGSADSAGRQIMDPKPPSSQEQDPITDIPNDRDDVVDDNGTDDDLPHHHFQMKDVEDEDDENVNEEIRQELKMKDEDRSAYFDTLADDVL